jgi:chemotaxis protein methyltransferase CheR
MTNTDTESIELDLLLEAMYQRYGYDFRRYARASVRRRVRQFLTAAGVPTVADLIPRVLHEQTFFGQLLKSFSVPVTEMFRDPAAYRAVRKEVVPFLKTFPFVRIWHAGCASGEEVYSLAILLREEGLYDRATVYATDFNDEALAKAREGIYPVGRVREYTANYQAAGGTNSFSAYYRAHYDAVAIDSSLKERITFANHNLATDNVFSEMHLVLCRNVLIYFNGDLQNRALGLFADSLVRGGFLWLGSKESLRFSNAEKKFRTVNRRWRLYQKRV